MIKIASDIPTDILIRDYLELNSSYKVAEKYNVSATAVKRLLKEAGVLRTQNAAASERNRRAKGKYKRSNEYKQNLSKKASKRMGEKNSFFGKTHSEEFKLKISNIAKLRTKERNPNYKNGQYLRRPRDFKLSEFKPIRNYVFNRDKYTCFYCKTVGGHLHAHHIIPYWVKPEAFLDQDNLITVCTNCHFTKAHKNNWSYFDAELVSDSLLVKYSLYRERLNELATYSYKSMR